MRFLFLFGAGLIGGALNSVAGGGSFIGVPALMYVGVPPVAANATTTLAMWPGSVASVVAYRREVVSARRWLLSLGAVSLLGGLLGGVLLVRTSDTRFLRLLPWLMLAAAVTFTFGGPLTARLRARGPQRAVPIPEVPISSAEPQARSSERLTQTPQSPVPSPQSPALRPELRDPGPQSVPLWILAFQLVIAVYGGYFGGGMGIMMLAAFSIAGMVDIHEMNGVKTMLAVAINGVALVAFIANGVIVWTPGIVMVAGGICGGYAGAALARRLDARLVRRVIILVGWLMTAYFFVR